MAPLQTPPPFHSRQVGGPVGPTLKQQVGREPYKPMRSYAFKKQVFNLEVDSPDAPNVQMVHGVGSS